MKLTLCTTVHFFLFALLLTGCQSDNSNQQSSSASVADQANETISSSVSPSIDSSFTQFLEKAKSNLPYSPSIKELETFFNKTFGSSISILNTYDYEGIVLIIYQLSEASSDELIYESFDNSGKPLDKLVFTSDFSWKTHQENQNTFSASVRFEEGLSAWDQFFIQLNDNGTFSMLNWSNDRSKLDSLSAVQIRLLRNRVFARYGYKFNSPELTQYFSRFSWYKPQLDNVDSLLTDEDKEFVAYLSRLHNSKQ